jgi:hypothetical protein
MYKIMHNGQVIGTYNSPQEAYAAIVALESQGQTGFSISVG